jgi:4'-phosphopantetheinyl transferase
MAPDEVSLYLIRLPDKGALRERDLLELSPAERDRARRFISPLHGLRYARSHTALRHLLGRRMRLAPAALEFVTNAFGKPALIQGGAHFNLSHSGDLALIGLAENPIGVDVEWADETASDLRAIAERMFAPEEFDQVASAAEFTSAFYRCWVRKEAVVKAEGEGLSLPLRSFSVRPSTGAPIDVHMGKERDRRIWRVLDVAVPLGYSAAMACPPTAIADACVECDYS